MWYRMLAGGRPTCRSARPAARPAATSRCSSPRTRTSTASSPRAARPISTRIHPVARSARRPLLRRRPLGVAARSALREEDPAVFDETEILLGHADRRPRSFPLMPIRDFATTLPRAHRAPRDEDGPRAVRARAGRPRAQLDAYREAERRLLTRVANPGVGGGLRRRALRRAARRARRATSASSAPQEASRVSDPAGLRPGAGCGAVDPTTVECGSAGVNAAAVYAGDRADRVRADAGIPVTVAAGEGDDRVEDGAGGGNARGRARQRHAALRRRVRIVSSAATAATSPTTQRAPMRSRSRSTARPTTARRRRATTSAPTSNGSSPGSGKDTLTGSADAEGFWAQGGNDTVDGGTGADWLNRRRRHRHHATTRREPPPLTLSLDGKPRTTARLAKATGSAPTSSTSSAAPATTASPGPMRRRGLLGPGRRRHDRRGHGSGLAERRRRR